MEQFGRIRKTVVVRLGELTKNEIQIVAALLLYRNGKSGKCNPGRRRLGELTGLKKQNLSRAISGLVEKLWITENGDGFDLLFDPLESNQIDYF